VIIAYFLGGRIAAKAISTAGTKVTKVNVSLGYVDFGLLRGSVGISKLAVDNPQGFADKTLLTLGSAKVRMEMGSLFSDTIKIDEIRLDGIDLVIEQKGLSTNLQELMNNVSSSAPAGTPPASTTPAPSENKAAKKLEVKLIEITNVKVRVKVLGAPEIPMKLNTIRLEDIGTGGKAVDAAALTGKILAALATSIAQEGGGLLPKDITGSLNSGLESMEKLGGDVLKGGKGVIDQGGGLIQGILGGKKK